MSKLLTIFTLSLLLFVAGCSMFDSLILDRAVNEKGEELFLDKDNNLTTEQFDNETGLENEPAYTSNTGGEFEMLTNVAATASGPFAPLIVGLLGLFGTTYAAVRGRRKVNVSKMAGDLFKRLTSLAITIYADFKAGSIDLNQDGVISIDEIKRYALESGVPLEAAIEMLDIAQKDMPPTEAQKRLDELVKKYAG